MIMLLLLGLILGLPHEYYQTHLYRDIIKSGFGHWKTEMKTKTDECYTNTLYQLERHPVSTFCCIELDTVDSQSKLYQNLKMKMTSCSLKRGQVKILIEAAFIGLLYIEWLPKWPQEQPQVHSAIIHNLLQWGTLHVLFLKTSGSKT